MKFGELKLMLLGILLFILGVFFIWLGLFSGLIKPAAGPGITPNLAGCTLGWLVSWLGGFALVYAAWEKRKQRKLDEYLSKIEICEFTCPVCSLKMGIRSEVVREIKILKIPCRKCRTMIHFDGRKIIEFHKPTKDFILK